MRKGVSIVICCYNSANRLRPTLEHIASQQVPATIDWEVIVVDNNSTDGTAEVAESIWENISSHHNNFQVVLESNPGLMNARLKGISTSKYSYIIFSDDDNSLNENYVEVVHEIFENNKEVAVCNGDSFEELGKDFIVPDWWEDFKSGYAVGSQGSEEGVLPLSRTYMWGAGLSFRKSALLELYEKGFKHFLVGRKGNSLTAGEDGEICMGLICLGYRLYYSSRLSLKHHIPTERINEEYLKEQRKGFGAAGAITSIYIAAINNKKRSWYLIVSYYLFRYAKNKVAYVFRKNHLKFDVKLIVLKELLLETLWMGPLKFNSIVKEISRIKTQAKQ